ncbi:hypothetical protein APS47_11770 [Leptospira kirschneri serovar Mozdok]|nr:hypothetical protein APS47_11770 [Leptospira kirschneri serovar Mozdok]
MFKKYGETKSVGTTANLKFYVEILKCGNYCILLETSKKYLSKYWDKLLINDPKICSIVLEFLH